MHRQEKKTYVSFYDVPVGTPVRVVKVSDGRTVASRPSPSRELLRYCTAPKGKPKPGYMIEEA